MKETIRSHHMLLRQMLINALFAALLCVLAPIAVPVGPIPVTLGLLGIFLIGAVLSPLNCLQAVAIYLALGVCGLPVFSGGASGLHVFFGPTGGYLWSYLAVAPLISALRMLCPRALRNTHMRTANLLRYLWSYASCCIGFLICYTCGTIQYCLLSGLSLAAGLAACVWPFIPFDLLKVAVAVMIGQRVHK